MRVALLRGDSPGHLLDVPNSSLDFDADAEAGSADQDIPRTKVAFAGHQHLGCPAQVRRHEAPKAFDNAQLRRIPERRAAGKCSNPEVESNDGRHPHEGGDRHPRNGAPLDPTPLGTRDAGGRRTRGDAQIVRDADAADVRTTFQEVGRCSPQSAFESPFACRHSAKCGDLGLLRDYSWRRNAHTAIANRMPPRPATRSISWAIVIVCPKTSTPRPADAGAPRKIWRMASTP